MKNLGNQPARLLIDVKAILRGKDFRSGDTKTVEETAPVVWAKISGDKKTSFKLEAALDGDDED